MAQFLSAATKSKIELRRDRIISLTSQDSSADINLQQSSLSSTPVALAAIQGAFRCVEVVGSPVDATVIQSLQNGSLDAASHQTAAGTPSVAWCGEQDGSVTIRQLQTGQVESRFPPTQKHIFPCSMVNVCSVEVWVGFSDGGIKIFSPQREKAALVEFRGHSTTVSALAFAALGVDYHGVQFVVSSSTDWTIIVWDARRDYSGQTPKAVSKVALAKSPIKCLSSGIFSPFWVSQQQQRTNSNNTNANSNNDISRMMADDRDRNLICAGCGNGSILMMELEPSRAVVTVLWETGGSTNNNNNNSISSSSSSSSSNANNPSINAVAFLCAAKGKFLLISGSTNGQVISRNALDGSNPQLLEKRPSAVLSVSSDKTSGLLWIGGSDGVITVYSHELQHLATLQHHGGAYVASIKCFTGNSSQRKVWICGDDGELRCFLLASSLNGATNNNNGDDDEEYFYNNANNNNNQFVESNSAARKRSRNQLVNSMVQELRETILRNGAQLHLLRTACWKLRQREQMSLESFCRNNMKASAFLGGPGWELVAMGIENIKMFRLKQRQYILSLQRATYGGFRASIHLGRRYFLKWIFYSSAQRYRASSLLVAQQFQNRHRFDIQARYLSRLWRETLRIERGRQLMNVAGMLNSQMTKGMMRTAFRRWMQWLNTRRSFKAARRICTIIGKQTDASIIATYWNALISATQHLEKMKKFSAATSAISRMNSTGLMHAYFNKWKIFRAQQRGAEALDQTMDSRGFARNQEIFARYFRKWSEYYATIECQRMEEELLRKKKEQEEWEAMIVCDKVKMQRELAERKPYLQKKLDEADAELKALEDQLNGQESYHAALQRETLFINEGLPIDPNAPIHEQVACVIEFLKARCIHCQYDIKLVGELNKKALALLAAPPRVPGQPVPVPPPLDTPFGAALLNAKATFNTYCRDNGYPNVSKNPTLTGYTAPSTANDDAANKPGSKTSTPTPTTPRPTAAGASTTTPKPATRPSATPKPSGKKTAQQIKEEREKLQRQKEEADAKALLAKRRAARGLPMNNNNNNVPGGMNSLPGFQTIGARKAVDIPEPYKKYWAVPVDSLPEARRFEMERMVLAAKQLIVGFDTVVARTMLAQRQLNYATPTKTNPLDPKKDETAPQQLAQRPIPIRDEWLHEFLVNAHILLKVAIEEYKKRREQGIETGGIDDLDLARSQAGTGNTGTSFNRTSPAARKPLTATPAAAAASASANKTATTVRTTTPPPSARKTIPIPTPTISSTAAKKLPAPKLSSPSPAPKPVAKPATSPIRSTTTATPPAGTSTSTKTATAPSSGATGGGAPRPKTSSSSTATIIRPKTITTPALAKPTSTSPKPAAKR